MNRTYGIAALLIGSALAVTAAVARGPSPARGPASASLDAALLAHLQEERPAGQDSTDPADDGQGETSEGSAQYAAEQEEATRPPQWQAIDDHNAATRGPVQPIPFNHRFHSTDLRIDCMYCHSGTERSVSGVVPPLEVCMGCHRIAGTGLPPIEELRGYAQRNEPVPWRWVNKLPEFVQFSHQAHLRNAIDCAECHGPVEEMDRVYQWAPLTMGWCLECHRGAPRDTDFATDHVLSTLHPPPRAPEDRQEDSFYPKNIDSQYGDFRGPTDCAACHY